ncbi:MAG: peptidoglycan DD-metalloendopeptidase family protein [Leptolyngbyaceae cyanobacterium bins.302]|nr:peptidoglycan DD-metalloendopeptidase family protein [Leptolyngbyaceae cyanobacterium bins.302]
MRLKSLLIGTLAVLVVGAGAAWSVGGNAGKWAWDLAPKLSGYKPDPKDINFYYPLPEVVEFTSPFGYRTHPIYGDRRLHSGLDLGAPEGMPVLSAHSGYVRYADWGSGYGKMVIVEYADGQYQTLYAHLSEILVREGEAVRPRQVIGKVGSTGGVTGPHLHFELLRKEGGDFTPIDPGNQVKSVEAFVAVRPSDPTQPSNPPAVAAKPAETEPESKKSEAKPSQPWEAPALDNPSPYANAAPSEGAIAKTPIAADKNIILDFNP